LHILAERIAENAAFRQQFREKLYTEGLVRAKVAAGKEAEKTKYEMYYKFEETVQKIPSPPPPHAGNSPAERGENVLSYAIETDSENSLRVSYRKYPRGGLAVCALP